MINGSYKKVDMGGWHKSENKIEVALTTYKV